MGRKLLSIKESARFLNCKKVQIYEYIKNHDLNFFEIDGRKYIPKDELEILFSKKKNKKYLKVIQRVLMWIVGVSLFPVIGIIYQMNVSKPNVIIDKIINNNPNPLNNEFILQNSGDTTAKQLNIKIYDPHVISKSGTLLTTMGGHSGIFNPPTLISGIELSRNQTASFFLKDKWVLPKIIPAEGIINFEIEYKDFISFSYKRYESYQLSIKDGKPDWHKIGNYGKKLTTKKINEYHKAFIKEHRIDRSSDVGTFDLAKHIDSVEAGNANGLAVDPESGNIFITTNSYGGGNNLWKFSPKGDLLFSTRVNYNTGLYGNIGEATFARKGNLFISASKGNKLHDNRFERLILEISQDGTRIFSSFQTNQYFGGIFGLTYNPENKHLFIATGKVKKEFLIRETELDGKPYKTHKLDSSKWPMDIAFDPFTKSIIALRRPGIFDQYTLDNKGYYKLKNSYELKSIGKFDDDILAFDINRSNGQFYIQEDNQWIIEINRKSLGIDNITKP